MGTNCVAKLISTLSNLAKVLSHLFNCHCELKPDLVGYTKLCCVIFVIQKQCIYLTFN